MDVRALIARIDHLSEIPKLLDRLHEMPQHDHGDDDRSEVRQLRHRISQLEDANIELDAEVEVRTYQLRAADESQVLREENSLIEASLKTANTKIASLQDTVNEQVALLGTVVWCDWCLQANELKLCSSSARLAAQQLLQKQSTASSPRNGSELNHK